MKHEAQETPISTELARYHLGDKPCAECAGARCKKCYQTGKHPKSSSWMSGLKKLMKIGGDMVFLSALVKYLKSHPGLVVSSAYDRPGRNWRITTRDPAGHTKVHQITSGSVQWEIGRVVTVGRIRIEFPDEVIQVIQTKRLAQGSLAHQN